jgi:guanylate kinase
MLRSVTDFKGTVVLVQGSSASGKSRLVAGVSRITRDTGLDLELDFAKRYTTRAPRYAETFASEHV